MVKLFRLFKIIKDQSKYFKFINEYLKLENGMDRIFFFTVIFWICVHFGTCFWLILAIFKDPKNYEGTWLHEFYAQYGRDANV